MMEYISKLQIPISLYDGFTSESPDLSYIYYILYARLLSHCMMVPLIVKSSGEYKITFGFARDCLGLNTVLLA